MLCHDQLQNVWYFKHGAIFNAVRRPLHCGGLSGGEDLMNSGLNLPKVLENYADAVLFHPLSVVTLLWQSPRVLRHNHRQPQVHSLADTAGAWLANEEIGQ